MEECQRKMRLANRDLNPLHTPAHRRKILKDANDAIDIEYRLDQRIKHWIGITVDNSLISTKILLDELYYLKKGRI